MKKDMYFTSHRTILEAEDSSYGPDISESQYRRMDKHSKRLNECKVTGGSDTAALKAIH